MSKSAGRVRNSSALVFFADQAIPSAKEFFLKFSRCKSIPLYQISIDNPQKDHFHDLLFGNDIDKNTI